ncbi:MAG: glycerol-3-phosphate dehydrogenase/oxidase [Myxococcaceae bacterium]|nr:glycerol-3-phosphate dehydrogenase/oxidase [Myxococcaceae bacterium]
MSDWRTQALAELERREYDLAIVGGGITGAGIARDAALRGLKVALIEKLDFGSGTSSKSSKLVHGGLRYLEQAELKLVFESVNERKLLMDRARHLVRPLPFLVTRYAGDRRWLLTLDVGLWIYDAFCFFRSYRNHRTYRARKALELEPTLRREGLTGAIQYYDCLTDDARLTLENVLDARALGAVVVNHARAGKLLKDGDRVKGLVVEDELNPGRSVQLRAKVVVNATGPWSDEVRTLAGEAQILKPTKGVHIVVDAARLPVRNALMMASPRDKRVVFCIPWGLGRTVIGTTDTFYDGKADHAHADRDDADYLLETANQYFPEAKLTLGDILATWTGLRPLLKPPEGVGAYQTSREHMIFERPGFLTIAGGKLTTYRRIAMEVVDQALEQLGVKASCTTGSRDLPGAVGLDSDAQLDAVVGPLEQLGLTRAQAEHLALTFGARAKAVAQRTVADPTAKAPVDPELPYLYAQVDEAVEHELAATLDDVLTRRVPLVLRGRDQGLAAAEPVAKRLAAKLGWSAERTAQELAGYREVVALSRRFRD